MGDAGVHGNNKIEIGDQRRCIGKINKRIRKLNNIVMITKDRRIGRTNVLLQADKRGLSIQKHQ